MTVEDLAVNRQVRTVFARNWVNLQRLDYSSVHGTVYVRGRMAVLHPLPPDPTDERDRTGIGPKFMLLLDKEIKKIPGVRGVNWQVDGWQRIGASWVQHGM